MPVFPTHKNQMDKILDKYLKDSDRNVFGGKITARDIFDLVVGTDPASQIMPVGLMKGLSVEEISRPGRNYAIDKLGRISFLGKKIDVGKGQASVSVTDKGLKVRANNTDLPDSALLSKFGEKITRTAK